jgi:hypothetical protein
MLEINRLVQHSSRVTNEDWKDMKMLFGKTFMGALDSTFISINRIFQTKSQETMDREAQRRADAKKPRHLSPEQADENTSVPQADENTSVPQADENTSVPQADENTSVPQADENTSVPGPTSLLKTPKKRTASAMSDGSISSFGVRSVHTTPKKRVTAETTVQALQNALVEDILKAIWPGSVVPVPWVPVRDLYISYTPYTTFTALR